MTDFLRYHEGSKQKTLCASDDCQNLHNSSSEKAKCLERSPCHFGVIPLATHSKSTNSQAFCHGCLSFVFFFQCVGVFKKDGSLQVLLNIWAFLRSHFLWVFGVLSETDGMPLEAAGALCRGGDPGCPFSFDALPKVTHGWVKHTCGNPSTKPTTWMASCWLCPSTLPQNPATVTEQSDRNLAIPLQKVANGWVKNTGKPKL